MIVSFKYISSRICLFLLTAAVLPGSALSQEVSGYKLSRSFPIKSGGGWDYIAVNTHRIFVSHGSQVNVLDESSGDSIGVIANTNGVHGIAFCDALNKGYTSNGKSNSVTVFNLKTLAPLKEIATGKNPDAIFYEPVSKKIITCNGAGNSLTIIDAGTDLVTGTIALSGKPETAVADETGILYVNIEEKNSISKVDLAKAVVLATWSLTPAEGPTGIIYDPKTHRLFAGCEKKLVAVDIASGKLSGDWPIADGCDGLAFDAASNLIFASCGSGSLYIAREDESGNCAMMKPVTTLPSARTICIDPENHKVFLPAAEREKAVGGQRPAMIPGSFRVLEVSKQ